MAHQTTQLRIPAALKPGDTVGIVAPAGHFDKDKLEKGIVVLKGMGFKVRVPDGLFEKEDYLAGPDAHRAELVNAFFRDRSVKAIVCARGGFGSIRTLSYIDFDSIQQHPKIFIGFSDISALLSVFTSKCNLVCFHGPMFTTLGESDQQSRASMVQALTSGKKLKLTPKNGSTLRSGTAVGKVSGGNLTTLCHLVGTPFEPDFNGHILVLEDIDEARYRIDRMLIQMKLAGCFNGLAGLIIGSFENCGNIEGIYRIVERVFRGDDFPILAGYDIGHGRRNMTLPLGLRATLDADSHMLLYHSPATRTT